MPTRRQLALQQSQFAELPFSTSLPIAMADDNLPAPPSLDNDRVSGLESKVLGMDSKIDALLEAFQVLSSQTWPAGSPAALPTTLPAGLPPAPSAASPVAPSVASPAVLPFAPSAAPFSALRTALFSGVENPQTFLNDLDRHFRLNIAFYKLVDEARQAMTGSYAVWFDSFVNAHDGQVSWSTFGDEFRRVYLSAQGLDNVFDHLFSHRMTGAISQFIADFNTRLARCPSFPPAAAIAVFRRALPAPLAADLERSRVTRFGGRVEWPSLEEIQSSAAALVSTHSVRPAPPRPAAWFAPPANAFSPLSPPSPTPTFYHPTAPPAQTHSFTPPPHPTSEFSPPPGIPIAAAGLPPGLNRRRAQLEEREKRGLCRYCGSHLHKVDSCPVIEEKEARRKGGKD